MIKRTGACSVVAADGRIFVMGGETAQVSTGTVESYGPEISLGSSTTNTTTLIPIVGHNFAADATVSISVDTILARTVTATSATGDFSTAFLVPNGLPPGPHTVTVVDARAQYPVGAPIVLTP
jgi:hypothetical protein